MGKYFFDQYSLLHYASGIVAYFWGISFKTWLIIHTLFEYIENTSFGIKFINTYLTFWPGGKPKADSVINSYVGDTIFAAIGWLCAYYLDKMGNKFGWYNMHIK